MNRIVYAVALLAAASLTIVLAGCGGSDDDAATASAAAQVPFDRAFIDAMVPHHQDAIAMATDAKKAGLSQPDLVEIADDIERTQEDEIEQMLAWREEWFGSREQEPMARALETLGLSEAQAGMEHEVDFDSMDDVDQAFAEAMIGHHEGAIEMARLAQDKADHGELKDLADDIVEAQEREVETMREHASADAHHG